MHSRTETSTETKYRVCGFLHFRIESIESVWIELHRIRIYLWVVEHVPGELVSKDLFIYLLFIRRTKRWAGRMSLLGYRTLHKRHLCEEREGDLRLTISFDK